MNVGILATGWIAEKAAETLSAMTDERIFAAAAGSRNIEKAKEFAEKFGIKKAYGSYEELAADDTLDLIYIASPHSHHYEHAKLCLEKGRNVLIEKAFTVNAKQARELVKIARAQKLLLAEAIWTRYMPSRFALEKMLESEIIGEPYMLTANLGYNNIHMERMYKPELAGGALLDLGVYVINFALMTFGTEIDSIESSVQKHESGTDLREKIVIHFKQLTADGKKKYAELYAALDEFTDRKAFIRAENGYIEVENINNCEWIRAFIDGANTVHFDVPKQITGYEYQFRACQKAILAGETECPEMPHEEIIRVMEIMDSLRENWGLKYPMED
ncbi:MAG: Gfo/Idh/MocA family oxidoreductase [Oscillospiraceae bacterium]|nr:Gfo/Idh/MocA family oxidoreductase [Oscillospiraceae bacterium]